MLDAVMATTWWLACLLNHPVYTWWAKNEATLHFVQYLEN